MRQCNPVPDPDPKIEECERDREKTFPIHFIPAIAYDMHRTDTKQEENRRWFASSSSSLLRHSVMFNTNPMPGLDCSLKILFAVLVKAFCTEDKKMTVVHSGFVVVG